MTDTDITALVEQYGTLSPDEIRARAVSLAQSLQSTDLAAVEADAERKRADVATGRDAAVASLDEAFAGRIKALEDGRTEMLAKYDTEISQANDAKAQEAAAIQVRHDQHIASIDAEVENARDLKARRETALQECHASLAT